MSKPLNTDLNKLLFKLASVLAMLSALLTIMRISLQAGQLYDDGLIGLYDFEMILLVSEGPLGTSSIVRVTGLALLLIAILSSRIRLIAMPIAGVMIASSFAFIGHATKDIWILGSLITVHLLAVSFWMGALFPLYKISGKKSTLKEAGRLANNFGKQASFIVPVLIVVGVIFVIHLTGNPVILFTTTYGSFLIGKLIIVAALLGLAVLNKLRLVPNLLNGDQGAALNLRKSILWESFAFLAIFIITAILTSVVNLPNL